MKYNYLLAGVAGAALVLSSCGTKTTSQADAGKLSQYSTVKKSYMDENIRPQDDFFQYSVGAWRAANPVPESESRWGSFNELDKSNKDKIKQILNDAAANNQERGSQNQILGDYYTSYVDMARRNELGLKPIDKELGIIKGIGSKEDVPRVLAELHATGVSGFFSFGVGQDLKNVDSHIAGFYQGGISLPNKDYYFDGDKEEIRTAFINHMRTMFNEAGYEVEEADEMASFVMEMETKMAEEMMSPAELRIPENSYNKRSLEEVYDLCGDFSMEEYIQATGIEEFDSCIVGQLDFFEGLGRRFADCETHMITAYLTWKVLDHYAGHLDENFVKHNFNFYGRVLRGTKQMKPIEDRVIDEMTRMNFGEWLGRAFVEKHFSTEAKDRVNSMVDNLLLVYRERINNLEWMSEATKKEALVKLNAIGRKLGYPEKWEDYSSLNFSSQNYLSNYREAIRFGYLKNIAKLNKPVDKDKWGMPAHMVNAYYHPLLNEIAFPAGIMQPPFFDMKAEDAVNYGTIGMVIGHEFTHGFDDMGSKFAADGSFTNWWTEEDRKAFEERTSTFGKTYADFCPVEGHCVNPQLTMGENIADLGGLTMALYAYRRTPEYKSGIKREGFTPDQRFFISYAQLWKINYTDEELKNRLANDPHSPGMYRVNGPLMNCPEFFEAFDVKAGDPMRNGKGKMVTIW